MCLYIYTSRHFSLRLTNIRLVLAHATSLLPYCSGVPAVHLGSGPSPILYRSLQRLYPTRPATNCGGSHPDAAEKAGLAAFAVPLRYWKPLTLQTAPICASPGGDRMSAVHVEAGSHNRGPRLNGLQDAGRHSGLCLEGWVVGGGWSLVSGCCAHNFFSAN